MDTKKGIVRWFHDDRGYGFIRSEEQDYFFHFKEIKKDGYKSLKKDDKVIFNPESSPKGKIAKNVILDN